MPVVYEAMILAGLGDADQAFHCLNLAYEQRSGLLSFLGALGLGEWTGVRADPRFAALVKQVGSDT